MRACACACMRACACTCARSSAVVFDPMPRLLFLVFGMRCVGQYTNFYVNDVVWYGTGGTLLFVMICTMILQAKDDIERHRKDAIVNSRQVNYYTGTRHRRGATAVKAWADVAVGDVLVVNAGEEIPADMVVLTSSSAEGDCFVETSNIDGESNLKVKSALSSVHHRFLSSTKSRKELNPDGEFVWKSAAHAATTLHSMTGTIKCELPNADVYRFAANVKITKASAKQAQEAAARAARDQKQAQLRRERRGTTTDPHGNQQHGEDSTDSEAEEEYVVGGERSNERDLLALGDSNLLLRGSVLRSTGWVVGAVVYTGRQTKVAMNSANPPSKLSRIEHTINVALAVVLVAQVVLVIVSDALRLQWVDATYNQPGINPWYLLDDSAITSSALPAAEASEPANTSLGSTAGEETDWPGWIAYFFTFFILYNNMVPISMYFTVELCCFVQAMYINRDSLMHCRETDTPARCRSSNLCQEIGQVSYIFADKTGTITRNEMVLKCVALADQVFGSFRGAEYFSGLHARQLLARYRAALFEEANAAAAATAGTLAQQAPRLNGGVGGGGPDARAGTVGALHLGRTVENWSLTANYDFWTILVCCHSAMVSRPPNADGQSDMDQHSSGKNGDDVHFDGESIDEITLLQGALKAGVKFLGKRRNVVSVEYLASSPGGAPAATGEPAPWVETYEILFVNAFSSSRMRMSIVARRSSDQSYVLFVKGADEVIGNLALEERTTTHLRTMCNRMAASGLRVLMVAKRELGFKECKEYIKRYNAIQGMVAGREDALLALAGAMEKKLTIVGVTGIEDKLQAHVSETIQTIRDASIRLWMLTGDKLTTANTIAFNTNLLSRSQRILYVRTQAMFAHSQEEQLQSMEQEMRVFYEMMQQRIARRQREREAAQHSDKTSQHKNLHQVRQASMASVRSPRSYRRNADGHVAGGGGEGVAAAATPSSFGGGNPTTAPTGPGEGDGPEFAVVITGPALKLIVGGKDQELEPVLSSEAKRLFVELAKHSSVVVACRVSPYQKAQLVELVRSSVDSKALTLAIGDGANDVPMLQKAHIGVGINGHEGMQAANNSDFTIARFSFLYRLLLVHGRWNYRRLAMVVRYSFYKNFVLVLVLFFYSNFTGFSGTTLFDGLLLAGYNVFLFWPIFCAGVFDQDVDEADVRACPRLYDAGRLGEDLNVVVITSTVLKSVLHAGVVFAIPYLAVPSLELEGIASIDIYGQMVFMVLIVVMMTRSGIITNTWNFWSAFWFAVTLFLILLVFVVYSLLGGVFPEMYGVYLAVLSSPVTYVICFSAVAVILVLDFALLLFRRLMCPTNHERRLADYHDDANSLEDLSSRPTDYCCSCAFRRRVEARPGDAAALAAAAAAAAALQRRGGSGSPGAASRSRRGSPVSTGGIELHEVRSQRGFDSEAVDRKMSDGGSDSRSSSNSDLESGRPGPHAKATNGGTGAPTKRQHPIYEQRMHLWRPRWSFASPDADCQLTVCLLSWSVVLVLLAILLLLGSGTIQEYSFVYSHSGEPGAAAAQWNFLSFGTDQTVVDTSSCAKFRTTADGLRDYLFATSIFAPHAAEDATSLSLDDLRVVAEAASLKHEGSASSLAADAGIVDGVITSELSDSRWAAVKEMWEAMRDADERLPLPMDVEDLLASRWLSTTAPSTTFNNVSSSTTAGLQWDGVAVAAKAASESGWDLVSGEVCHLTVSISEPMAGPVYVMYGVGGLHQNVLFYKEDAPWNWLRNSSTESDSGDTTGASSSQLEAMEAECAYRRRAPSELYPFGGRSLAPCGLLPNSMFNDTFRLVSALTASGGRANLTVRDEDDDVPGPLYSITSGFTNRNEEMLAEVEEGAAGADGNYSGVQFLHETYPGVVSKASGVESQRFQRWMRASPFLSFRKLYGHLRWAGAQGAGDEQGLEPGTNLTFLVVSTFNTDAFNGTKALVVTNAGASARG